MTPAYIRHSSNTSDFVNKVIFYTSYNYQVPIQEPPFSWNQKNWIVHIFKNYLSEKPHQKHLRNDF